MTGADGRETREFNGRERRVASSSVRALLSRSRDALAGGRGSGAPFGKFNGHVRTTSQEIGFTSCGTANYGGMRGAIRKNIIGHGMRPGTWHAVGRGMPACREQISARGVLGSAVRTFALLDEQASEHGAGVFLHPLVEQSANLLAEIGGVGKTRKFIALKRIARRREKELPRRLGSWTGHDSLLRRIYAR